MAKQPAPNLGRMFISIFDENALELAIQVSLDVAGVRAGNAAGR